jgi:uncharacterized protein YecE (DUF72 family)
LEKQVPQGFLFSLKFPRVITHIKMLKNCQKEVEVFLERVNLLQDKIGVLLLQFPSTFGTKHVTLLLDFLQNLPKTQRYAVEVRNQKLLNKNFYPVLRDNNVALAWVDSPFISKLNEVTSNFIYIRWKGDRRQIKGTLGRKETNKIAKIKAWTDRIKPLLEKQTEVFGYFSKYYSGYPPSDVRELLSMTLQKEAAL